MKHFYFATFCLVKVVCVSQGSDSESDK